MPSGRRIIRATAPSTPTEYSSSGPGASTSGSRPATITIVRSPRSTSLISSMLRGWPTLSGTTMSGNVTASRSGRTPICVGQRADRLDADPRVPRRSGAPTSITAESPLSIGTARGRPGAPHERQLDAQHPVLVAGAGPLGVDLGAELDRPAGRLRARSRPAGRPRPRLGRRRGGRPGSASDPRSAARAVDRRRRQLGGDDRPRRIGGVGDIDRRATTRCAGATARCARTRPRTARPSRGACGRSWRTGRARTSASQRSSAPRRAAIDGRRSHAEARAQASDRRRRPRASSTGPPKPAPPPLRRSGSSSSE